MGVPIYVNVTANIAVPGYNPTIDHMYFTFEGSDKFLGTVGKGVLERNICGLVEPYYTGFILTRNTTGYYQYFGQGSFCFLDSGEFLPILVMVNGTSGATTYLQEGTGQSFALSVETPSTLENYGLTVGELVLAGVLVFFAVVESLSFLRDIYPKAFPYIYEYEEDRAKKKKKKADDKKVSLNPEDRKPEPL